MKIILASKSKARRMMLENAGLDFECIPSGLEEEPIVERMLGEEFYAPGIALELAKQKALKVSREYPDALVIGSDQTLDFRHQLIMKAESPKDAREKLAMLRGEEHSLISAVSVALGAKSLWQHMDDAHLMMRDFDDEFLDLYCARAGSALVDCVGAYEFEGMGSWLFSSIKGDFYTILGMPLLALLGYLRDQHGMSIK